MLLQATASLISIKESDKKELKINTPWQNIGKIPLLFIIRKEKISIKKNPVIWRWKYNSVNIP